jgi:hypothetical protein
MYQSLSFTLIAPKNCPEEYMKKDNKQGKLKSASSEVSPTPERLWGWQRVLYWEFFWISVRRQGFFRQHSPAQCRISDNDISLEVPRLTED